MEDLSYNSIELKVAKPEFEHYLRFIFRSPEGAIKVNRNEILGKFLFAIKKQSEFPIKSRQEENVIKLILPLTKPDRRSRYTSFYYTPDDEISINDYIEAIAFLDFRMMIQTGVMDLKMERKAVITIFSEMIFKSNKYEALKKYEYRRRILAMNYLRDAAKCLCL